MPEKNPIENQINPALEAMLVEKFKNKGKPIILSPGKQTYGFSNFLVREAVQSLINRGEVIFDEIAENYIFKKT